MITYTFYFADGSTIVEQLTNNRAAQYMRGRLDIKFPQTYVVKVLNNDNGYVVYVKE